jgi:hypothetical protein
LIVSIVVVTAGPCSADTHAALKADRSAYAALRFVGLQPDDGPTALELRACSLCHSTLAIEVPHDPPPP